MALWLDEAAHNQKAFFLAVGRQGCVLVETANEIPVNTARPPLGGKTSTVDTTVFLSVLSQEPVDAP